MTFCDWQLVPMLETLYNAPSRTSNHIYMVLVIFLILSQDSTFNATLHKLVKDILELPILVTYLKVNSELILIITGAS